MQSSLNQYYVFYTVAQAGNFSAAAAKLFISQPAVSKSVAQLEKELETTLFYRSNKGVRLTDTGEILYRQLETAFRAIENGENEIKRSEALGAGHLSIGVSTTLCKYILLPYLRQYMMANPHVKVSISCQSSYETIEGLKNGTLDIGLVGETRRLSDLHFQKFRDITDDFVCSAKYLQTLQEEFPDLTYQELLSKATFLMLDQNNLTRQYVDQYLSINAIMPEQVLEVTTMDLLIEFAKTGLGIACVIRDFVEKEIKEGSLVIFPTKVPIPSRQIGFAFSSEAAQSPAFIRFLSGISPF